MNTPISIVAACNAQLCLLKLAAGEYVDPSSLSHKLLSDAGLVNGNVITEIGGLEVENAGKGFKMKLDMLSALKTMTDPDASEEDIVRSIVTIVKIIREAQGPAMKGVMPSDPLSGDRAGDATSAYVRQDSEAIKH